MNPLNKLIKIEEKLLSTATISARDIQFCFQQLESTHDDCIVQACDILTSQDLPVIEDLLQVFPSLQKHLQSQKIVLHLLLHLQ